MMECPDCEGEGRMPRTINPDYCSDVGRCSHGGDCFKPTPQCERCEGTGEIHPSCLFCGEPNTTKDAKEGDDCEACTNAPKCFSCGDPLIGEGEPIEEIYVQRGGFLNGQKSNVKICKTCDNRNHEAARALMASFSP